MNFHSEQKHRVFKMTRSQRRALVCAVAICPVMVTGFVLMLRGYHWEAYVALLATAVLGFVWVTKRGPMLTRVRRKTELRSPRTQVN
jgi:membrane protein YdbS with pleckstrin-like domain